MKQECATCAKMCLGMWRDYDSLTQNCKSRAGLDKDYWLNIYFKKANYETERLIKKKVIKFNKKILCSKCRCIFWFRFNSCSY